MAEMTDDEHQKVRSIIESFRDAALGNLTNSRLRCGPDQEDVDAFVKYDTWLKLDDAEKDRKAAAARKNFGPQA